MEIVSGILLGAADVIGVKWIRDEKNTAKKVLKTAVFLVGGIISVIGVFVLIY